MQSTPPSLAAAPAREPSSRDGGEAARWQEIDEILRRIVSRLCIAARGQDTELDGHLTRLTTLVRKPVGVAELDPLLQQLTAAIARLDDPSAPARPSPLAPALQQLLKRLDLTPALQPRVEVLQRQLQVLDADGLAPALEQIAALVNEQRGTLEKQKAEAERLLSQVTARLDDVAAHLAHQQADQQQAQDHRETFDTRLRTEVRELGSNVSEATDLGVLQGQVRKRLETISGHLQEFRAREDARQADTRRRTDAMRQRIEELERQARTLQESVDREHARAHTDPLTGVPNRAAWEKRVADALVRWRRQPRPLCLACWDIDRFKSINDKYGHAAGDKVLQIVARFLSHNVRETDFVARYGGEEFVALFDGVNRSEALLLVEQLRLLIAGLGFRFRNEAVAVTISCGITEFIEGDTSETAFERADAALYQAKSSGRNRSVPG